MRPVPRAQRVAAILWILISVVVWNGVYDLMLLRGIKETLFRAALSRAGDGPAPDIARIMAVTVFDSVWVSTIWASTILLAGLLTIRYVGGPPPGSER